MDGMMFFMIIIFVVVSVVSNLGINNIKKGTNRNESQQRNNASQRQPDKYRTINSHYNQSTLQGKVNSQQRNVQQRHVQVSPLAGQFVAGNVDNEHAHAYEHKVQPIDEASVHEKFEDRKEAYRERKAQMKADLPKTSYSKVESQIKNSSVSKYRDMQGIFAKNGDNGSIPASDEVSAKCGYCGAINIVPRRRSNTYKCYFCREEV